MYVMYRTVRTRPLHVRWYEVYTLQRTGTCFLVPVQRHREGPDANVPVPVPVPVPGYRYHKLHKLIVVEYAADYGSMDAAENFCRAVRGVLPTQCEPRPRVVLLPRGLAHEAVHVVHGTPWSCIAFRTSHRATSRCTSRI